MIRTIYECPIIFFVQNSNETRFTLLLFLGAKSSFDVFLLLSLRIIRAAANAILACFWCVSCDSRNRIITLPLNSRGYYCIASNFIADVFAFVLFLVSCSLLKQDGHGRVLLTSANKSDRPEAEQH
ncbi:hypothetical protein Zmor_023286 [Zophobas morio]|uniref:Uncharacterized protein n=1 Tax=Zophobas morio TaxID=2755281 RepID=A0AA38HXH1_9CUCU|nr:hypothetical protein Zmor_023286 [Zophobas morio]